MEKRIRILFIAAVMALCLAVLIATVVLPRAEPLANEVLTAPPTLVSGGQVNIGFFSELGDWLTTGFAFRHEAIDLSSRVKAGLFASSNTESVILGKNGWLYYASTADDYMGIPAVTSRQAANIAISLSLAQEYAEKNGADFLVAVAPNKNTIVPENMPARYRQNRSGGTLELLYGALRRYGVAFVDLRETLTGEDYHRLDSHWNNRGAAKAGQAIMAALGRTGADCSGMGYGERADFPGDLYGMLYPLGRERDLQQYYELPGFEESGTPEDIRYETANPGGSGSLLMYRDSFGNALSPFLAAEFESARFSRSVVYDLTGAAKDGRDAVILEIAQRNIRSLAGREIVIESPVRELPIPDTAREIGFTASAEQKNGLTAVTGSFDPAWCGEGERIYALAGGTVYEAFPVDEASFALYLPEGASADSIRLILTSGGEWFITEEKSLS